MVYLAQLEKAIWGEYVLKHGCIVLAMLPIRAILIHEMAPSMIEIIRDTYIHTYIHTHTQRNC